MIDTKAIDFDALASGVVSSGQRSGSRIANKDAEIEYAEFPDETLEHNPKISKWLKFTWNGKLVEPGDKIKLYGERGTFIFKEFGRNSETGGEWIELTQSSNGHHRAFRPERIKKVTKVGK